MTITMDRVIPFDFGPAKPDICTRHYQFDFFVRKNILPLARYEMLLKNNSVAPGNNTPGILKEPYFKLKSRDSNLIFYVETKYLPQSSENMVQWCEPSELIKYEETDACMPVYIVIGEGKDPANPCRLFLFSIRNVWCNKISYSQLGKYQISPSQDVDEIYLATLRSRS